MNIFLNETTVHLNVVFHAMEAGEYEYMEAQESHDLGERLVGYLDKLHGDGHTWEVVSWFVNFSSLVRTGREPDDLSHSPMMAVLEPRLGVYIGALSASQDDDEVEALAAFLELQVDNKNVPPDIRKLLGHLEDRCISHVEALLDGKRESRDISLLDDIVRLARLDVSSISYGRSVPKTGTAVALDSQIRRVSENFFDHPEIVQRLAVIVAENLDVEYLAVAAHRTRTKILQVYAPHPQKRAFV